MQKNPLFFTMWGMAKATENASGYLGKLRIPKGALKSRVTPLPFGPHSVTKRRPQGQPSFRLSSGRPGKGGVLMRRLWHVLEVVAIYALKRLIDWFFTTKN